MPIPAELKPYPHFAALRAQAAGGIDDDLRARASVPHRAMAGYAPGPADLVQEPRGDELLFRRAVLEEVSRLDPARADFATRPQVPGVALTIDSYVSQDLDDGLAYARAPGGQQLVSVSLADVSAWVRPGSAIDHAARRRQHSIYGEFAEAPMLPPALSHDLLSLHQDEPRLAKTIEMRFDAAGRFVGSRIYRSVFTNRHRLDATDAELARRGQGNVPPELTQALRALTDIATALSGKTHAAGEPSVKKVLELLNGKAYAIAAEALDNAGLETSYRNQAREHERVRYGPRAAGHATTGVAAKVGLSGLRHYACLDAHRALDRLIDGRMPTGRLLEIDRRMRELQHGRLNDQQPPLARGFPQLDALFAGIAAATARTTA